jgi:hypothetical protein
MRQAVIPAQATQLWTGVAAVIQPPMGKGQLCLRHCSLCPLCQLWLGHSFKHLCDASHTLGKMLFTAITCLGYEWSSFCCGPYVH